MAGILYKTIGPAKGGPFLQWRHRLIPAIHDSAADVDSQNQHGRAEHHEATGLRNLGDAGDIPTSRPIHGVNREECAMIIRRIELSYIVKPDIPANSEYEIRMGHRDDAVPKHDIEVSKSIESGWRR